MFSFNKIIRYINQNKKKILIIIAAIAGLIIVIQFLNGVAGSMLNSGTGSSENISAKNEKVYQPNKTVFGNTVIKENTAKDNNEIIDKFIKFCINGEIEEAYNLLTPECKEICYSSVESFKNNYCKKIFSNKDDYNIQSWITNDSNYTYKVRFTENLLATGKSSSGTLEDYITIVKNNDELKLNINSYVSRQNIDKEEKRNNINVKVRYKDIYIDREEYLISVTNNTDNDVMIDSLNTTDGISLIGDNKKMIYQAFTNELGKYDVTVPSGNTKRIRIKFSKEYNLARSSKQIAFSDIILNIDKYKEDPNNEENKAKIVIEI